MPENDSSAQRASQRGHHNIVVQARGDNIDIQVGLPHLNLIPASVRISTEPRREIDILNPAYQAVPLVGREADLEYLFQWLSESTGIGVTALVGPGGSGKTRLALEILQRMPDGWQGGFLTTEEASRFLDKENLSEWSWQKPTLIVVDYAAPLARTLARWFAELADHPAPQHSLRILLLERHADPNWGWYRDLADSTWHGQSVRDLLSISEPRHLKQLNGMAQRREVLSAGLQVAANLMGRGHASLPLPNPGEDLWFDQRLTMNQWANPLLLLMAAVIATSDGLNAALKLSRVDLAKRVARRELDRIRYGTENPVSKDLLTHLYACVTLCGGIERDKAIEVAELEFAALQRQYPGGPGQAVHDLARLLGVKDYLPPLLPDLLGEALVCLTLAEYGAQVTTRLAPVAAAELASHLVRSAQDFGPADEKWPLECLRSLVSEGRKLPPFVFLEIEAALPLETVVMREFAVEITQFLVGGLTSTSPEIEVFKARLWNNLAKRQLKLGRHKEALASAAEAVRRRLDLVASDREAHLPDLAESLDTQACVQLAMGRPTEALTSATEAVRIRRELSDATLGAIRRPLAMSLNNKGCIQAELRQFTDALVSITEAAQIHTELAAEDPAASLNYVAGALNNQSCWQSKLGQHAEALASITEAVQIWRDIADDNPDSFRPDLAGSLANLACRQRQVGKKREALTSATEAVTILRGLSQSNADAFQYALARSLERQAGSHFDLEQHGEALALVAEAVKIDRELVKENRAAILPVLADSLQKQALAHSAMGDALHLEQAGEALASITESVFIYRELAGATPNIYNSDLLSSLVVMVTCLDKAGRPGEARDAVAEYLSVLAPLFLNNPLAYESIAEQTVVNYIVRCKGIGEEPDPRFINLFASLFARKAIMFQIASLAQQAIDVIAPVLPFVASHAAIQVADGFLRQPGTKFFDWLVEKLNGSPAVAALTSDTAETNVREQLDALKLEIEKLAGTDLEFRQQLAAHLKELAGASAIDANQTSSQTGDSNKSAQAVGMRIKIQIS